VRVSRARGRRLGTEGWPELWRGVLHAETRLRLVGAGGFRKAIDGENPARRVGRLLELARCTANARTNESGRAAHAPKTTNASGFDGTNGRSPRWPIVRSRGRVIGWDCFDMFGARGRHTLTMQLQTMQGGGPGQTVDGVWSGVTFTGGKAARRTSRASRLKLVLTQSRTPAVAGATPPRLRRPTNVVGRRQDAERDRSPGAAGVQACSVPSFQIARLRRRCSPEVRGQTDYQDARRWPTSPVRSINRRRTVGTWQVVGGRAMGHAAGR